MVQTRFVTSSLIRDYKICDLEKNKIQNKKSRGEGDMVPFEMEDEVVNSEYYVGELHEGKEGQYHIFEGPRQRVFKILYRVSIVSPLFTSCVQTHLYRFTNPSSVNLDSMGRRNSRKTCSYSQLKLWRLLSKPGTKLHRPMLEPLNLHTHNNCFSYLRQYVE
ncbi:unnamed protein product [Lupinus luteus]|uniref:Uncharacterized protein n=1 Tax=Lupinus luteus TaxID=3873 RepID=A0AAV1YHT5_LUPLU